ncbi:MAG: DUF1488 family protein [Alphaproteobacteria bacterium]|nr:DUF1488 family protein [Alphaproteobacteria bacterium]MDE2493169.1 DUF1488 family protein [Alphaproteobacteria bacterium]
MPAPHLLVQTAYAELLERCAADAFGEPFGEIGGFVSKAVRGKRYWYFQEPNAQGARTQKYVGPETPELLERIAHHKQARSSEKERRALVSTLVRSFRMPRPIPQIGDIVAALAQVGIFRLRAVLVGTVAYQTYPAMLGTMLPAAMLQTGDVDIAQFANISVAVEECTPPILDTLREIDKTFRAVPRASGGGRATSYMAANRFRVDFLTPNEGPDTSEPKMLPALQTDAEPLRFLDFLIHDPEQAVVLHNAGILVNVPAPSRFAVHKLIVSQRRRIGSAKRDKDIRQAQALIDILLQKQPGDFARAWREAHDRGKAWRRLLLQGLDQLPFTTRDEVLKALQESRSIIPGLDLKFADSRPAWVQTGVGHDVSFVGQTRAGAVDCRIQDLALADHFGGTDDTDRAACLTAFNRHRFQIERIMRLKFLYWPVDQSRAVKIRTDDVPRLLHELEAQSARASPRAE